MNERGRHGPIEWAVMARPLPGQSVCGDSAVAIAVDEHRALFGVIDGLGHGEAAAAAASCAAEVLGRASGQSLDTLLGLCHRELGTTRGAAITLAGIDFRSDTLEWLGVGNVTAVHLARNANGVATRAASRLTGGIVGYRMPELVPVDPIPIRPGSLLIMTTDGIADHYLDGLDFAASAEAMTRQIMGEHGKLTDDALVLVARHRGSS